MRFTRTSVSHGFTLVEVMVVAPIIILFIGAFVGLIVSLTGESLKLRESNSAAYNAQDAIDDMQANADRALAYLSTTGPLQAPQGPNSTVNPITNTTAGQPDTLIIKAPTTTTNPIHPNSSAVYSGTGACNSQNPVYPYMVVYLVINNTLYKRTILQQSAACQTPWQRNSCTDADAVNPIYSSVCQTSDEKLLDNVQALDVQYFLQDSSTSPVSDSLAESASAISISITMSKPVSGDTVSYTASARASGSNMKLGSTQATTTSGGTITTGGDNTNTHISNFTWNKAGNAVSYSVRYRPDASTAWNTATINVTDPNQPSYTYTTTTIGRKQVAEVEVTVNTASGSYLYGTASRTIPLWTDCPMGAGVSPGNWSNYGSGYNSAGYTRTTSGIVGLKGLVAGGAVGQTVCTLPVGFRPKFTGEKLIFQTAGYQGGANSWARVDVQANGNVDVVAGENPWVSLDGIMFLGETSNYTWTNNAWSSGWAWYGAGHSTLRSTLDSVGRVHVQGLTARAGAFPAGSVITNLGSSRGVTNTTHSPALSAGGAAAVNVYTDGTIQSRASAATSSWQQLQLLYHPSSFASWQTLPLYNSWQNYGAPWPTAKCYKGPDDVVIMTGLINRASNGNGTEISNTITAGCGSFGSGRLLLHSYTYDTPGRIDIQGGSMSAQALNQGWASLDGVRYIAD